MKLPQMNINQNSTKAEMYQSLYGVNQCLQEAIWHIERLKTADILTAGFAEVQRLAVEEIRSAINASATNSLHTSESGDAYAYQEQRLALEQQLKDFQPQLEVVPKVDDSHGEDQGCR